MNQPQDLPNSLSSHPEWPDIEPFERQWMEENVSSIQAVMSSGQHRSLFYPACGKDTWRAMRAYDADELWVVDSAPEFAEEITQQMRLFGDPITIEVPEIGTITSVSRMVNGRQRTVNAINGDARRLPGSGLMPSQVDVLHIYLPTGADNDLVDDDGETFPAIVSDLNPYNYRLVSEGGFFVLGERRLFDMELPVLLGIAGLREHQITRRHPYSVMTSWYPEHRDLANLDRTGYIYQKQRTVDEGLIVLAKEAGRLLWWQATDFEAYREGRTYDAMGMNPHEKFKDEAAARHHYQEFMSGVDWIVQQMSLAVKPAEPERLRAEMQRCYRSYAACLPDSFQIQ